MLTASLLSTTSPLRESRTQDLIIPYRGTSRWISTVDREREPFDVAFQPYCVSAECGVKHTDVAFRGTASMTTTVVPGEDLVGFPGHNNPVLNLRFGTGWNPTGTSPSTTVVVMLAAPRKAKSMCLTLHAHRASGT